ncbi:MAG: phosphatidate cytidylyltransferase [Clostridia bacterium]|nr:phosphatidate cytidylyltransferase [Clostridia bacterium]
MKTRIISGIVIAAVVVAVLIVGMTAQPLVITVFLGLLSAVAVFELLCNVAKINNLFSLAVSSLFSLVYIFFKDSAFKQLIDKKFIESQQQGNLESGWKYMRMHIEDICFAIVAVFVLLAVVAILKNHKKLGLAQIVSLVAMPIIISSAFLCLGSIINGNNGIYYLLLLINFSSVCDMGAYFIGVNFGTHKLCPEISPKKTVEGALGGILSSIVVSFLFTLIFNVNKAYILIPLTLIFCIIGMLGDLFASAIKRSVGIKDYGNLIPGHGGILDRLDSVLFIAPLLYASISLGVL